MWTMVGVELKRLVRDPVGLFFIVGLPVLMYSIFGGGTEYSHEDMGNGNVAMLLMVNLAVYGAVTATVGVTAQSAVEKSQGWGRQLALTPMSDAKFVMVKAITAATLAIIPILAVFGLGSVYGAEGTMQAWIGSFLAVVFVAVAFSLYGLAIGFLMRSESAASVATGLVVVFSFLGTLFMPLSGIFLTIAKFTPLYGFAVLARYPINEGYYTMSTNGFYTDSLTLALISAAFWTVLFAIVTVIAARRGRARQ